MRRTSVNRDSSTSQPVSTQKVNHCLISPFNQVVTSVALERRSSCWFIQKNVSSDLIVNIEDNIFHLHKVPMISKSEYLNRLVFQRRNNAQTDPVLRIELDNLPGGFQIFELVVKFCYGLPINLKVTNIVSIYCAAHFLEMNEDFEQGNLISKTETFLSFIIFSSWKGTFQILKKSERVCSSWIEALKVVKRCSESIAWKASLEPKSILTHDSIRDTDTKNSKDYDKNSFDHVGIKSWWFEDVSALRMDHFVEFIKAVKIKKMSSDLIGSCISYWGLKRLPIVIKEYEENSEENAVKRVRVENLIRILPVEENSVSCSFLLYLLKVGLMINIDKELSMNLETRVSMMLENCSVEDLIVKNFRDSESVIDVSLVVRVIQSYARFLSNNSKFKMWLVASLVDEYLIFVAKDDNLSVECFMLLAGALPVNARNCDDELYTAIDMYLKSHPKLKEEERRSVCRFLEYQKLSTEARDHVMKNDRLSLNFRIQFILLEQVKMTRSILAFGSSYGRTKSQSIVRSDFGKKLTKPHKEVLLMKEEIEKMQVNVNKLQGIKNKLQKYITM